MRVGYVKWYNSNRGFGFIRSLNKHYDSWFEVFFHKSELQNHVVDGDNVFFEVRDSVKGPVAINVRKRRKSEVS